MKHTLTALTLMPLLLGACGPSLTGPIDIESLSIRVEVSGGFGGMDLAYAVDSGGAVVATRCASLCTFEAGDTLFRMTPAQVRLLGDAIESSGIGNVVGLRDFGVQCCDQFEYLLVFEDVRGERSIRGSSEALPDEMRSLVHLLESYRQGRAPVVVEMGGDLERWHRDAVDIVELSFEPPILTVTARHGGGCTRHDLDLVAWTGWMESFPVQVGVALTHDAHGDVCRALLTRELTFDLSALREAYVGSYGPGPATLAMNVRPAAAGSDGGARVAWNF